MATREAEAKHITRMSGEDRRRQIIDVAIRLFSQKGFRGTTTREIALAAGVNEAIIFRHFATKHDLYSAIIDQMAGSDELQALEAQVREAMQQRDDQRVFQSIALNILDYHERDDSLMRLIFYSALEGHELCDIFFRNQVSRKHRLVADYIRQRIAEGAFRKVDPNTAARAFFGTVLYHAQLNALYGQARNSHALLISNRQAAERFADLFLSGLRPAENRSGKSLIRRVIKKKNN